MDDELNKTTIFKVNQTSENYLEVSIGNDTYNLTKFNKIKITDAKKNKYPNRGSCLVPNWIKCNDKNKRL